MKIYKKGVGGVKLSNFFIISTLNEPKYAIILALPVYSHGITYQSSLLFEKTLSHWLHWCGVSPVCSCMYSKINLLRKGLVTLTALVLFLPSVGSYMLSKLTLLWESLVTLIALIWFLSSVCSCMKSKINLFFRKGLVTLVALVWCFLQCVFVYV